MQAKIKKLNPKAILPVWNNKSAGCDLSSTETYVLKPGERKLFKTGLTIEIPSGFYGRIAPRSGLAFKSGIDVLAGVIDEDYRGDIGVILINFGQEDKTIVEGDKIAQLIFETYTQMTFVEVDTLETTTRGAGGYGSTDRPVSTQPAPKQLEGFKLGARTTIEKHLGHTVSADTARIYLMKHDGDIYSYTENGNKGLCVVDSSGQVLGKFVYER